MGRNSGLWDGNTVYGAEGYSEDGGSRFFQNVGNNGIITEKTAVICVCTIQ